MVEETRTPGASVLVVARRHDINAYLLFKWKRLAQADEPDRPLLVGPEFVPDRCGRSGGRRRSGAADQAARRCRW